MQNKPAVWLLATAVLVMTGCSSSSGSSAQTSTTARRATSSPPTTPTTTTPSKATGGAPTSADAVAQLVDAWRNHDLAAAKVIADPVAVMGIFGAPVTEMNNRGCTIDDGLDQGGCIYWAGDAGLIQINTEHRIQGWVVTSANYDALSDGNDTSGNAPDAPPPTTLPPSTLAGPTSVPAVS